MAAPALADPVVATGTVQDALGRPLAGVRVSVVDRSGKVLAQATTDAAGRVALPGLEVAECELRAELEGYESGTLPLRLDARATAPFVLALSAREGLDYGLKVKRLDRARTALNPTVGSTRTTIDRKALENLPAGERTPLNEVLLQTPSVAQGTQNQVHVRGDHGNLQYRINGVMLPEGVSSMADTLDLRIADRVEILTGALPAQYGLRTAGVVDLTTRTGRALDGLRLDLFGGTYGEIQPSLELGGSRDGTDYYLQGNSRWTDLSSNPSTSDPSIAGGGLSPGRSTRGFGYVSTLLGDSARLSVMGGASNAVQRVPGNPLLKSEDPKFPVTGGFDAANPSRTLAPNNAYGVVAFQNRTQGGIDYQVSAFGRSSAMSYSPDRNLELATTGLSARVDRAGLSGGLQADVAQPLADHGTLRYGGYLSHEQASYTTAAEVFDVDAEGKALSNQTRSIDASKTVDSTISSLYVQDEWRLSDVFTTNAGLRFDNLAGSVATTNQLSPRLGFTWKLLPGTNLFGGYARTFTPPTTELVDASSLSRFDGTSAAIEPAAAGAGLPTAESAHYLDLGINHELLPGWTVGLEGYYRDVTNLHDEGQYGSLPLYTIVNLREGKIFGGEFTTSYRRPGLSTYLNVAYGDARGKGLAAGANLIEAEEREALEKDFIFLDHAQRWTGSAGAVAEWLDTRWQLSAVYGSGLPRDAAEGTFMDAYLTLNLGAARSFELPVIGAFEGRVTVNNVLDTVYQLRSGESFGENSPAYGQRRTFLAGISKSF